MSSSAPVPPISERLFVTGRSGSGKTHYITEAWLPRLPRVLIVDMTEEWAQLPAIHTQGPGATIRALYEVADRAEWRIVADLDEEEVRRVAALLVPRGQTRTGYVSSIGGMALYLDEVDMLMGHSYCPRELRSLWRRGRHAGLTVLAATQRPGAVNKEVSAQSSEITIFSLTDPNDRAYLRRLVGPGDIARVEEWIGRRYHYVTLREGVITFHAPFKRG